MSRALICLLLCACNVDRALPNGPDVVVERDAAVDLSEIDLAEPDLAEPPDLARNGFADPTYVKIGASAVVTGDFDEDGMVDVAATGGIDPGVVTLLFGAGDGTFPRQSTFSVGMAPQRIIAADFNSDGHLDLATTDIFSQQVSVLLGDGKGQFTGSGWPIRDSVRGLAAADVDADGKLDLLVTNDVQQLTTNGTLGVLRGNGDGTFGPVWYETVPMYRTQNNGMCQEVVVGDFDEDGRLDAAVACRNGNLYISIGLGDGTFAPAVSMRIGEYSSSAAIADLDGDGHLDLVNISEMFQVLRTWLGDGHGAFTHAFDQSVMIHGTVTRVVLSDFDLDGHLDAVTADSYPDVGLFRGQADGSFATALYLYTDPMWGDTWDVAVADLNRDGRPDLVVADGQPGVAVFLAE